MGQRRGLQLCKAFAVRLLQNGSCTWLKPAAPLGVPKHLQGPGCARPERGGRSSGLQPALGQQQQPQWHRCCGGCSCCRPRWLRQGQPFGPSRATALHPPRSPVATPQASRAAALHGPDLWSRICAATAAESAQPWVRAGQPQAGGRQRCLHQQLLARQAEQAEGLWRPPRAVVGAPGSPWARAVLSQPWGRSQQHPVRPRSGARQPLAWGCPARGSPGRGCVVTLPLLSMGSGDGA